MPTTATRSNWMASHADALKHFPLNAITLPGTHDSGTYAYKGMEMPAKQTIKDVLGFISQFFGVKLPITMALDMVWKVLLEQTITQQRTITEQLEDGIRYLDIRTDQDAGELYIVHGIMPHCDKKVIGTGTGNDQGVVQDVAAFLADHPQEIVLLDFQEFQHTDQAGYARLLSQVLDHLGPYLLGPELANGQPTFEATLEAIWADQPNRGRAIVLFDRSEAAKIDGTRLWEDKLLWDRSKSVFSPWGNTASTERLENFLLMQHPDALMTKGYFNILQGQMTPMSSGNIFKKLKSIEATSRDNNAPVIDWIKKGSLGRSWNIIILDYYELGGIDFVGDTIEWCLNGWPKWSGSKAPFWAGDTRIERLASGNSVTAISPKTNRGPAGVTIRENLHLFYRHNEDEVLHTAMFDGMRWSGDQPVAAVTEKLEDGPVAVWYQHPNDQSPRALIAYQTEKNGPVKTVEFDGQQWGNPVTTPVRSSRKPALAFYQDTDQQFRIMMGYRTTRHADIAFAILDLATGTWTDQGAIRDHANIHPQTHEAPSLLWYKDSIYCCYRGKTTERFYVSRYALATKQWSGNERITVGPNNEVPKSDFAPTMMLNGDDLLLFFKGAESTNMYMASFNGTAWSGNIRIKDTPGAIIEPDTDQPPILVRRNDWLFMVYKGAHSDTLYASAFGAFRGTSQPA